MELFKYHKDALTFAKDSKENNPFKCYIGRVLCYSWLVESFPLNEKEEMEKLLKQDLEEGRAFIV